MPKATRLRTPARAEDLDMRSVRGAASAASICFDRRAGRLLSAERPRRQGKGEGGTWF